MPFQTRDRKDLLAFLKLFNQGIPKGRSVITVTDDLRTRATEDAQVEEVAHRPSPLKLAGSPRLAPPRCFLWGAELGEKLFERGGMRGSALH